MIYIYILYNINYDDTMNKSKANYIIIFIRSIVVI